MNDGVPAPAVIRNNSYNNSTTIQRKPHIKAMGCNSEVLQMTDQNTRDEGSSLLLPEEVAVAAAAEIDDSSPREDPRIHPASPAGVFKFQASCCVAAQILSFVGVLLVCRWVFQLGGMSWQAGNPRLLFNWHPLLMITAFFFMTVAALAFRTQSLFQHGLRVERRHIKWIHGMSWLAAATCAFVALVAVFRSHNNPSNLIANLYSFHSWMGITVVVAYVVQFTISMVVFYDWVQLPPSTKTSVLSIHKVVGPMVYLATACTILLGIQEKEGFVGCSYTVTEPDIIPFRNVGKIPSACWTSHGLGIVVLLVTILTSLGWYNFEDRRTR